MLRLSELRQVQSGDLLSFLDLALVGLNLLLQLVCQVLHPLVILLILVGLSYEGIVNFKLQSDSIVYLNICKYHRCPTPESYLEGEFFDASLAPAQVLLRISMPAGLVVELCLQLLHARLQLRHRLARHLQRVGFHLRIQERVRSPPYAPPSARWLPPAHTGEG